MSETRPETTTARNGGFRDVLAKGTRLRGYEIRSVLGRGAFGITYRAHDTTLHRDVAIKEFLPTSLALREGGTLVMPRSTDLIEEFVQAREKFLDEARTLARLERAPAVIRVHDFLEDNGTAYMVMALIEGETLEHRLKRDGHLRPSAIERLLYPMLDGLEAVHSTGFLHRDIKPSNIVLDAEGHPTLIDFGAARAALAERTAEMTAIFTPGYAAAEQFSSTRQGPWTDIYALSATLHHAITGHAPPRAFDRVLEDTYTSLQKTAPAGFTTGLLRGLDAGLAVRSRDRPQSIADWRPLLHETGPDITTTTVEITPITPSARAPTKSRRKLWLTMAGFAVVALVGAALLFVDRPSVREGVPAATIAHGFNCLDQPNPTCVKTLLKNAGAETDLFSPSCSNYFNMRSTQDNWKDIWTTSIYSYAPGGGTPGGGRADGELKIGGWGDWYYTLISFDLSRMPKDTKSTALVLFSLDTGGTAVPMHVDRILSPWSTAGDRLWWRDLPQASAWGKAPAPRRNAWYMFDITGLYQEWRLNKIVNYGIQLRPFGNNNNHNLFVSSRGEDRTRRPALLGCN